MLRYKIRNGGLGYKPKVILATVRVRAVSSLFFFYPLHQRQVFIFVASLRITMKTPLGKSTHLLCGWILWEATDWALAFHMYENKH